MDVKNWNFYNNKNSYTLIMELTTHLLKRKYFNNQIKILYPLWGIQPNLENQKAIESIKNFHSIEEITTYHNYNHCIDIHSSLCAMGWIKQPYKTELAHSKIDLTC